MVVFSSRSTGAASPSASRLAARASWRLLADIIRVRSASASGSRSRAGASRDRRGRTGALGSAGSAGAPRTTMTCLHLRQRILRTLPRAFSSEMA